MQGAGDPRYKVIARNKGSFVCLVKCPGVPRAHPGDGHRVRGAPRCRKKTGVSVNPGASFGRTWAHSKARKLNSLGGWDHRDGG